MSASRKRFPLGRHAGLSDAQLRPRPNALRGRAQILLPICSRLHHHALKRRLTPAEDKMARCLQHLGCAVFFVGREDSDARAVAQVLCAA
jgi:hypothetical protein